MNINLYFSFVLMSILFANCGNNDSDKFTYEIINEKKHLEITKMNLVKLYQMSDDQFFNLLKDLDYQEISSKKEAKYFMQKSDPEVDVFQTIILKRDNKRKDKVIDITWISFDGKDRFDKLKDLIIVFES